MTVFKTEHQFQAACVLWHSQTFPEDRGMLHCNMNNSYNAVEGNKAKALGVVPGVSDLEYIAEFGVVWFIELKIPGKTQSEEQIKFMNKVRSRGHHYIIIETLEEYKALIWKIKSIGNS